MSSILPKTNLKFLPLRLKSGQNKKNEGTINGRSKLSVKGVVAICGHFATLCQEVDLYEAIFFSLLIFKKKRQILLHF